MRDFHSIHSHTCEIITLPFPFATTQYLFTNPYVSDFAESPDICRECALLKLLPSSPVVFVFASTAFFPLLFRTTCLCAFSAETPPRAEELYLVFWTIPVTLPQNFQKNFLLLNASDVEHLSSYRSKSAWTQVCFNRRETCCGPAV